MAKCTNINAKIKLKSSESLLVTKIILQMCTMALGFCDFLK